jgi:Ca-activated chloride channel family protein
MMSTIETAQAENVVVYTIRYTEKEHGKLTARNKYGTSVMDRIAKETGGAHIDAAATDPRTYFRQSRTNCGRLTRWHTTRRIRTRMKRFGRS